MPLPDAAMAEILDKVRDALEMTIVCLVSSRYTSAYSFVRISTVNVLPSSSQRICLLYQGFVLPS